jgi:hypothetical protein
LMKRTTPSAAAKLMSTDTRIISASAQGEERFFVSPVAVAAVDKDQHPLP